MAKGTGFRGACSSRLTRARKKKKRKKGDGNYLAGWKFARVFTRPSTILANGETLVARFAVCRQGYGNKIIKGIEEGGIRESEREVYPVADRMRNGEKEKGNRRFSGSLLRNRVNSRSTGITWFKRYVRLSPIKFPVVDLDRPLLLPASIIKIGIMNSSFELIRV